MLLLQIYRTTQTPWGVAFSSHKFRQEACDCQMPIFDRDQTLLNFPLICSGSEDTESSAATTAEPGEPTAIRTSGGRIVSLHYIVAKHSGGRPLTKKQTSPHCPAALR